jgi:predicted RNA-binding Zn ribbon-like protein
MSQPPGGDLELLRLFVNTREVDRQIDLFDTPDRLREWLCEHGLLSGDAAIDRDAHGKTLEFREAVRALAVANGGAELDADAIATLNRIGADIRLSISVAPNGRGELGPAGAGVDQALGHLYAILYTAMVDGSFERLKGCANDTCLWLFYDHSKNRSKKWCDMQTCGNAANARAYRQRRRDSPAT